MAQDGESSPEEIVKNLRAAMLEVIAEPPKKETDKPSKPEVFWLSLLAGNAVFLARLFPENAKGPLEFAKEFVPWLFGGMFVVVNDWFRHWLLRQIRKRWFKAAEVAVFFGGMATLVGVVPITPNVKPDGTIIVFDTDEPVANDETNWLAIHDHTVNLSPGPNDRFGEKRLIELPWRSLVPGLFRNHTRDWRLLYRVAIETPDMEEDTRLTLAMEDGEFDHVFLRPSNLDKWGITAVEGNARELTVRSKDPHKPIELLLQWGYYCVYSAPGCKPERLDVEASAISQEHNYVRMKSCAKLP
jgi:hypothetical protein